MHRSLRSGLSSYLLSGQILLAVLACCALPAQAREVSHGLGANLVWPGLLRRLDRRLPGYEA